MTVTIQPIKLFMVVLSLSESFKSEIMILFSKFIIFSSSDKTSFIMHSCANVNIVFEFCPPANLDPWFRLVDYMAAALWYHCVISSRIYLTAAGHCVNMMWGWSHNFFCGCETYNTLKIKHGKFKWIKWNFENDGDCTYINTEVNDIVKLTNECYANFQVRCRL